jgi:predicted RNA-binding Zn-ribbon protein involved in translation (DUF1610 family)
VALKISRIPFSATNAEKNINFLIQHHCPQCGAPATLEETDRIFSCQFCRVKSLLVPKPYFRYLFAADAPKGKDVFYVPFWRFKGMFFACGHQGIHHRFIDVSRQALHSKVFPISVGVRSQALKLKFVSSDTPGRFLTPNIPLTKAMDIFDTQYSSCVPKPILHQAHIGESLSLLYSPFYVDQTLYDGISNVPAADTLPEDFDANSLSSLPPRDSVRFIPALCPNCGWDLRADKDAIALACENCGSIWQAGGNGMEKIHVAHAPATEEGPSVYVPFWRIKAEVKGLQLDSYADLVRQANLPKVIQEAWEATEFRFWIPAFKVQPRTFLRLSTTFTLSQPQETLEITIPKQKMLSVNLPVEEAAEVLKTTVAGFLKPAKRLLTLFPDIRIRPIRYLLVYLPFIEKHHEFINLKYRFAINKNQIKLSRNL